MGFLFNLFAQKNRQVNGPWLSGCRKGIRIFGTPAVCQKLCFTISSLLPSKRFYCSPLTDAETEAGRTFGSNLPTMCLLATLGHPAFQERRQILAKPPLVCPKSPPNILLGNLVWKAWGTGQNRPQVQFYISELEVHNLWLEFGFFCFILF